MRTLELTQIAALGVSAASGLVVLDGVVHLVADDVAGILRYDLARNDMGSDPILPLGKPLKPDLEALVALPGGQLLALGSGSKPQRRRGLLIDGANGARAIDASELYAVLDRSFPRLNIEGAVARGGEMLLAQRSNGRAPGDAIVALDLALFFQDLQRGSLSARGLKSITPVALGSLDGVPLGFTDLAVRDGEVHFVAAAEATDDPYDDAPFTGSIVGVLDARYRVRGSARLTPDHKIEGLHHWKGDTWLFVADADDPASRAPLLSSQIAPDFFSSS